MELAPRAIERKVVTALFCDVVGSTELGERLDPEDIDRLMGTYHRLARRRIEANGGTVEKFIGDAVVGVFGAPNVHEDDAARAIRSALAIIDELAAAKLGLEVRIGIQTGEAVVRVGEDRTAEEGLATGDILNTAARLQNAASPGGIAAGDPTYRATERDFDWADLGEVPLKGKALPVHVWRPVRARDAAAAPPTDESTPFLGRDRELATLVAAFERARTRPAIELVTVIAEPGMGKSRLIRELSRQVRSTGNVTWLRGRCLPYGDGVSFWALAEIVKARAGILEGDDQATIGTKLDAAIPAGDPEAHAWMRERLAPLAGLRTEAEAPTEGEAFTAWARFIAAFAADGPAVVVIEDLHWADAALVSFLVRLADDDAPAPLLLVVSARPEVADRHPTWLERAARSTTLQLLSLDETAIRTLVAATVSGAPEALIATVLERAAGSPLYAEQLAALARERALSTGDATLDAAAIPPTIQALLAARIDALPRELKSPLLDASVVGRVFWSGAVASLEHGDVDHVTPALEALAQRELTRPQLPSSMAGEAEYGFWHALLRDVAYSFLPRAARLAKHRAAAAWITERARGQLGDLAEIVADHLERALDLASAMEAEDAPAIRSDLAAALLAGAEHSTRLEPARAISQLQRALEVLDAGDPRRADAYASLGAALYARTRTGEAAVAYEAAITAYRARGEEIRAAELTFPFANALRSSGEGARGQAAIDAVRPILEANPGPGLIRLYIDEAFMAERRADDAGIVAATTAAIDLARSLGLEPPYVAKTMRGQSTIRTPEGWAELHEGVAMASAAGDNRHAMVALGNAASTLDDLRASLQLFDEASAVAARFGLSDDAIRGLRFDTLETAGRWDELLAEAPGMLADAVARGDAYSAFMIRFARGAVESERGALSEPYDTLMDEAPSVAFAPFLPGPVQAFAALVAGDTDRARRAVVETLRHVGDGRYAAGTVTLVRVALAVDDVPLAREVLAKSRPGRSDGGVSPVTDLTKALVLEAEGDHAGALALFEASRGFYDENGWVPALGLSLAGVGRCKVALGDVVAGLDALRQARRIAAELKAPPMLADIDEAIDGALALAAGPRREP